LASALSHAVAALSLGTCFYRPSTPKRVWLAGALCSILPDLDVIALHFGIRYGDFWGHRGFTHSLLFAACLATLVAIPMLYEGCHPEPSRALPAVSGHRVVANGDEGSASHSPSASASSFLSTGAWLWTYLFLATASHGLLDAMTDGGLGVAFFSPFNNDRYFLPWRPIRVSPIGISRFFSDRGLEVLASELLWIWLPSVLLAAFAWFWHGRR